MKNRNRNKFLINYFKIFIMNEFIIIKIKKWFTQTMSFFCWWLFLSSFLCCYFLNNFFLSRGWACCWCFLSWLVFAWWWFSFCWFLCCGWRFSSSSYCFIIDLSKSLTIIINWTSISSDLLILLESLLSS